MKKIFLILAVLLLVTGCLKLEPKENQTEKPKPVDIKLDFKKTDTFEGVFNQVVAVDKKYQINFRKEALFGAIASPERLKPALEDLNRLREVLSPEGRTAQEIADTKNKNRTELDIGLLFLDARINMLESEKYFHLGYSYGNQGLIGDGFYCVEVPTMVKSLDFFDNSAKHAADAIYYIDLVLTDNTYTWDLVGVNEEKPVFYNSPIQDIFAQVKANREIVKKYCADEPLDSKRYITFEGTGFSDLFIYKLMEAKVANSGVNTNA